MSKIKRAASIPLVTHDPFFSIWSSADHLYDRDPVHWSGASQGLRGYLNIDGMSYAFLGNKEMKAFIPQVSIDVTATSTEYVFENQKVRLTCRFTSPLLPDDMLLVSRPCTYVDFEIEKKVECEVTLQFYLYPDVVRQTKDAVLGFSGKRGDFIYSYMGRAVQMPLGGSNDAVAIDWGYAYVACKEENANICFNEAREYISLDLPLEDKKEAGFILAYDDLLSMNYFGHWKKAYWAETYHTILDAIDAAFQDKEEVLQKAREFDRKIEEKAYAIAGEEYVFLCNMSFRQVFAAHKLITDENGEIIFLSKENDSNGCVGTTDVSYPSLPLFLMFDTEYCKGMLRPIFRFAECDVWEYDFAPHDVGRYPYAWGQVYACKHKYGNKTMEKTLWLDGKSCVFPPFYMYPAGSEVYKESYQMPVEECGNMLIMTTAICKKDGNAEFAKPYWNMLKLWKDYLVTYGADPGNQLCTDDFAGQLSHNVNLSAKAIVGIEGYAILADMLGDKAEAQKYHQMAKEMATDWEVRALSGDHYRLVFDQEDTWSLKYNLVWDKLWGSNLFSEDVYRRELDCYISKLLEYGVPLDSRGTVAKSDWILWCAAMAEDKEQSHKLIASVANYLENTNSRIPFGDCYDAGSGLYCRFIARSVQGGDFMPMLFYNNTL